MSDVSVRVANDTTISDEFEHFDSAPTQTADVEAERVKLKVGTFELDVDGTGYGKVLIDGKEFKGVQAVTVEVSASDLPTITMRFLPRERTAP